MALYLILFGIRPAPASDLKSLSHTRSSLAWVGKARLVREAWPVFIIQLRVEVEGVH